MADCNCTGLLNGNSIELKGLNLLWILIPFYKHVLVSFFSSRKVDLCLDEELYSFLLFKEKASWVNVIESLQG